MTAANPQRFLDLRNRLVHEYMRDPEEFAGALLRAQELVPLLITTYNRIRVYAQESLVLPGVDWPAPLA